MDELFKTHRIILGLILFIYSSYISAVIIDESEFDQANLSQLQNESQIFRSIGMGIALSLAQCEGEDLCKLNVDADEVKELINTLDTRIDNLVLRQESATDPEGFDKVLTAYISERDTFSSHLEKIETITSTLDEDADLLEDDLLPPEADFPVESAIDAQLLQYEEDLDFFEEDELEDDEDLGDLPDLPDLDSSETIQ